MTKKIKVGIAGYGIVGKRRHEFISSNPLMEVVAVADKSFTENEKYDDGIKYFKSYEELIKGKNLDAVFICLSNDVAAGATCLALENGYHVFCEKPPGRNLSEVKKVLDTHKSLSHLKLKYGFNHRYHDSVKRALDIVRSGELGQVINLRGVYGKSIMINFASDWRHIRDVAGGGILLDQGIHMLDLLRLFAGEFEEIHSFVSNRHWNFEVEDNAYALMRTTTGVVAMLHSTATEWRHRFNLQINLTKGSLILSGILSGTKSYGQEELTVIYRGENDRGNPRDVTTSFIEDNSWKDEIDDFAHCIAFNRLVTEGTVFDAYKTMELVFKIYTADKPWKERYNIQF